MTDDERLSDLLLTWEDYFEQGKDIPAERLCHDRITGTTKALAKSRQGRSACRSRTNACVPTKVAVENHSTSSTSFAQYIPLPSTGP
jgi:hypothetical protein